MSLVICALVQKNLIYIRRNIIKSLLQLFYPCLILIMFISVLDDQKNIMSKEHDMPKSSYMDMKQDINFFDDNYYQNFFNELEDEQKNLTILVDDKSLETSVKDFIMSKNILKESNINTKLYQNWIGILIFLI